MTAVALALHILGAVVWVGGMFAIYACLRPALGTLQLPQRLRLMRVTFQKFFRWVWLAILLLLASGYWMLFTTFGGFAGASLYIHLMQMIGWLMIALFVWLFCGPWLAFKRAALDELSEIAVEQDGRRALLRTAPGATIDPLCRALGITLPPPAPEPARSCGA